MTEPVPPTESKEVTIDDLPTLLLQDGADKWYVLADKDDPEGTFLKARYRTRRGDLKDVLICRGEPPAGKSPDVFRMYDRPLDECLVFEARYTNYEAVPDGKVGFVVENTAEARAAYRLLKKAATPEGRSTFSWTRGMHDEWVVLQRGDDTDVSGRRVKVPRRNGSVAEVKLADRLDYRVFDCPVYRAWRDADGQVVSEETCMARKCLGTCDCGEDAYWHGPNGRPVCNDCHEEGWDHVW